MTVPWIFVYFNAGLAIPEMDNDEQQSLQLFEDGGGDRALIAADLAELSRIYADDYIQYDETGKSLTKQAVISNLKPSAICYISMTSTGRRVPRDNAVKSSPVPAMSTTQNLLATGH